KIIKIDYGVASHDKNFLWTVVMLEQITIAVLSTLASGGAATAAWRITCALTDAGHESSFFVLESSGNPLHIPLLDNDDAFWRPALFRRWGALTSPEAQVTNAIELFSDTVTALHTSLPLPKAIREAEIIYLHWVAGMLFSPALLQAVAGKKVVWTLHDTNAFTGGCHYAGACRSFLSQCRDCPLLKKPGPDDASARGFYLKEQIYPLLAPFLITPSTWLAEEVKASVLLGKYPVAVIPYPLDMEVFRPPQDRMALRRKLGLSEDAFVILSGSEHLDNPRKNAKALFEALALLSEQTPALPVVVMTYGCGQPLELAFPIRHFGYVVDEAVIAELYGAADLFVHTARHDNLPLSLCEAQACGTPTLCFAVGGCPETMLPEKTGFLAAEASSQSLAEKLRVIIANRDRLDDMRDATRAFAEKRFDSRTAAAAYTEVFKKAAVAPGLAINTPLFADLLQNQIA
ncbi:MAG: glycosyltransferase, partial [Syntrophaceae bacterium]|nr:glycosyltransferase [Syntrophaceae bacterium]